MDKFLQVIAHAWRGLDDNKVSQAHLVKADDDLRVLFVEVILLSCCTKPRGNSKTKQSIKAQTYRNALYAETQSLCSCHSRPDPIRSPAGQSCETRSGPTKLCLTGMYFQTQIA